jgi:hypothetical protein
MRKSNLEYSTDALNVKSQFYNKEISVYVEGKEDIIFWESIFKTCQLEDYYIEDTNGFENLTNYMDKIIDDNATIIVACDCDHSPFILDYKYNNLRIIKTYGYSIENTMYCIHNIEQSIKRYAKTRKSFHPKINEWYNKFAILSKDLLKYDIANIRFSKGTRILGDKCNRFLKSEDSIDLSPIKINHYLSKILSRFTEEEIQECTDLIDADERELRYLIKGHFLTNGVINLIKQVVLQETGIKVSISIDSLYSLMVTCINTCDKGCPDLPHLTKASKDAFATFQN